MSQSSPVLSILGVTLMLGIGFASCVVANRTDTSTTQTSTPKRGLEMVAVLPGAFTESVPAAASQDAYDELVRSAVSNDLFEIEQMLQSGRAFYLDPYTTVLVLDPGFFSTEVRVLDGPFADRKAWISTEYLSSR